MTTKRIAQIRARLAAATPGPWKRVNRRDVQSADGQQHIAWLGEFHERLDADVEFIANAPDDIAWLLGENYKLKSMLMQQEDNE